MLNNYYLKNKRLCATLLVCVLIFSNVFNHLSAYAGTSNVEDNIENEENIGEVHGPVAPVTGPAISVSGSAVTITGTVKEAGSQGTALSGAAITINGYESFSTYSTYDGSYSVSQVDRNYDYSISAAYEGYESASERLKFDMPNDFYLRKIDKGFEFKESNPTITFKPEGTTYKNQANGGNSTGGISFEIEEGQELANIINQEDGELEILKPGLIKVKATRAGDEVYSSSEAFYTLTVDKANLDGDGFTFENPYPEKIPYVKNGTFTNIASSDKSKGIISYSIESGNDVATIDENTGILTLNKTGTVVVKATIEEDEIYKEASTSYAITIDKGLQEKLVFQDPEPSNLTYAPGLTYANELFGGSGQGKIEYEIVKGYAATIIDSSTGELAINKAGSVTVRVRKFGDDCYKEAFAEYTITIDKANQAGFEFNDPNPDDIRAFSSFKNKATGGQTKGNISYRIVSGSENASINKRNGDLFLYWPGTVVVEARKAGDDRYNDAIATYTITVKFSEQPYFRFENSNPANLTYREGLTYKNEAIDKHTSNPVVYKILEGEDVADIDSEDGILYIKKAGTVKVQAVAEGDNRTVTATEEYTITIDKGDQKGFEFNIETPNSITYDPEKRFEIKASGGESTGDIGYMIIEGKDVASIDPNTGELTLEKAGKIVIEATKDADECYNMAKAIKTIYIQKAEQTDFVFEIMNPESITYNAENNTYTNQASGGQSGLVPSYEIIAGDAVTIDKETGVLTIEKSGEVTIKASLPGDDCYLPISTTYTVVIDKADQTDFEFDILEPDNIVYNSKDNKFVNIAQGGQSGKDVIYRIIKGDAANINMLSGELTILKSGDLFVEATLPGDQRYNPLMAVYKLTIEKDQQEIKFNNGSTEQEPITIYYGNNYTNTAYEVMDDEDADGRGYGIGQIQYSIIYDSEGVIEAIGDKGELRFSNSRVGEVAIKATKQEDECYHMAETTYYLRVDYLDVPDEPYTIIGESKNTNGWYCSDVTIEAKAGYELSYSNELTNNIWASSIVIDEEGPNARIIYLRRKAENGYDITDAIDINEEEIQIDKTPPTSLDISYSKSIKDVILETITFGIYQSDVTVTLTAEDEVSGIETFRWEYIQQEGSSKVNEAVLKEGIIERAEIDFDDNIATASFVLTADEVQQYRGNLYYQVTDKAGWTIEKYDEKVIIVDSIAPIMDIQYSGSLVRKTDRAVDDISQYIYSSEIEAIIEVEEANFFDGIGGELNDVKITVTKDGVKLDSYKSSGWEGLEGTDRYQKTIVLEQDGDYIIEIEYNDKSLNEMQYTSSNEEKGGVYHYRSNIITKDTIAPQISIEFDYFNEDESEYYNKSRTAYIKIAEKNLDPSNITLDISATNLLEETMEHKTINAHDWKNTTEDVWEASLNFDSDAIYTFGITCKDLADNEASKHLGKRFVIDKSRPDLSLFKIDYNVPISERILENITFGFYNPSVTVTIEATDLISGINHFVWNYKQEDGTSKTKNVSDYEEVINSNQIDYYNNESRAVASFTLSANELKQYRGNISYIAVDKAGNTSDEYSDSNILVVDTIEPVREVQISPAQQVVDKSTLLTIEEYNYKSENTNAVLYYGDTATLTLNIDEANFIAEEVEVLVNDVEVQPEEWIQDGDQWTSQLVFIEDGEYIVKVNYTDDSGNKMSMYQSEKIIIDKIQPKINVEYNPNIVVNEIDGRKYYDQEQIVTISIIESNFRADDIEVNFTAKDVQGNTVTTIDYEEYLKERNNWTKEGDINTATIVFKEDANYTFDISYRDLALNEADVYKKDEFTVDTSKPTNLSVSLSQNIYETILNAITFGYYKEGITVTISAEDDVSSIEEFQYSCIKSDGASDINAELLQDTIRREDITYYDDGKRAVASFSIPDQMLSSKNQFDGKIMFTAIDRSSNSEDMNQEDRIIVDNIAPTAEIFYNEPVREFGNVSYYDGDIEATIRITEANFNPDDVVVSLIRNKESAVQVSPEWTSSDVNTHNGVIRLSEDGDYRITVNYTDRSMNTMEAYESNLLTIDTMPPLLKIEEIAHEAAYNDEKIGFVITTQDINIDTLSFDYKLECLLMEDGKFVKKNIELPEAKVVKENEEYLYVIDNLDSDGVYTFEFSVKDMSGNTTSNIFVNESDDEVETLTFSVNRQGSVYSIDESTFELVSSYYVKEISDDIVLEEINVDPLVNHSIALNNSILSEGTDYKLEVTGGKGEWHKYTYKINKSLIAEEGEYNIILYSKDRANNEGYSDIKGAEISFVVDRTPPRLSVSGMEQGGRYQVEKQDVTVIPLDDGGKLNSLNVVVLNRAGNPLKDELGNDISELVNLKGDDLLQTLEDKSNKISFEIPNGLDLQVIVTCSDSAFDKKGNSNMTVFEVGNITVSPDWYVIFYANKPLFYGTIAGIVATAGITIGIVYLKRRKRGGGNNSL